MFEIITVELVIQNHINIVFGCCYRAPRSSTSVFLNDLDSKPENVCHRKNAFLFGDFNIDLLTDCSYDFKDTMHSIGLVPLITVIDNIFTSLG